TWRLNERHYGGLQGLNKQETVDKHGKDQVLIWRRSYDIPPPECDESSEYYPGNDPRYANVDKSDLPKTESLKLTGERFMPIWESEIAPAIKSGKKVLIAAHGNTLRSLVKYLDNISEDEITGLNIPTGVPLVYELDDDLKVIPNKDAIAPLQGLYLGDLEDVRARIEGVANQTNFIPGRITITPIRKNTLVSMSESNPILQPTFSLTSAAAQTAVDAAEQEAFLSGWKVTIAIADVAGIPLLVKRCDDAFAASYEIAVGKAKTAALFRKPTGVLEDSANVHDGHSRSSLLSAPFVLMRGGVPIFVNGMCVGAVGVSGVKPDEDEQVAMAAVNALSSIISSRL
ncbi:hypothetical protein ACHAXR_004826, partial [Thalassiosira sp. AJA248-18]